MEMIMNEKWTPTLVTDRLEEAARTLKRLPPVKHKDLASHWPPIIQEYWEAYGWDTPKIRMGPPTPEAISRMDEVMEWLLWLDPDDVRLVWLRAERINWKLIMQRFGLARSTISAHWKSAICQIVAILNQQGKMSGHLSSGH